MLVVNRQQFQDKTVLSVPTRTRQFLNFILNTCAVFNTRGGTNHAFRRLLNRINGSGTNEKVGTSRVQKLPIGIKLPDPFGPLDPGEKVEQGRQKGTEKPPPTQQQGLFLLPPERWHWSHFTYPQRDGIGAILHWSHFTKPQFFSALRAENS